mgnify:CR=1 FL=1
MLSYAKEINCYNGHCNNIPFSNFPRAFFILIITVFIFNLVCHIKYSQINQSTDQKRNTINSKHNYKRLKIKKTILIKHILDILSIYLINSLKKYLL